MRAGWGSGSNRTDPDQVEAAGSSRNLCPATSCLGLITRRDSDNSGKVSELGGQPPCLNYSVSLE